MGADIDYLTLHARSRPSRVGQKVFFSKTLECSQFFRCRFALLMKTWQPTFTNMVLLRGQFNNSLEYQNLQQICSFLISFSEFQVPWGCCRRLQVKFDFSMSQGIYLCLYFTSRPPWRDGAWLDCIITDPPYGIRETTYKVIIGNKLSSLNMNEVKILCILNFLRKGWH